MKKIVQWLVEKVSLLVAVIRGKQVNKAEADVIVSTEDVSPAVVLPTVGVKNEQANQIFDQVLDDCLKERTVYKIFCRPVGGSQASNVVCEVTRKYQIGMLITRADGRKYEIYRIKKTKRTRIEASGMVSPKEVMS